ncbi:hypothetical protein [Candidatus Palauibacter sp.]|uniref:hypothetical protein n=1 Tax=Candidatus Palauibacter sp. TaxID=3101350 RepID=UPI003B5913D7
MRSQRVRNIICAIPVAALVAGVSACEHDNNPYGPAYRTVHRTIIGAYRPLEELSRRIPELPDDFRPTPPGGDIRLVFGSVQDLTGRLLLPGRGPGGSMLDTRLYGTWEYDVVSRRITMRVDQTASTEAFETVLQVTILDRWIRIEGVTDVAGQLLHFDLGKSRVQNEDAGGGGPAAANRATVG